MSEAKEIALGDATFAGEAAAHNIRFLSGEVVHGEKEFDGRCPTFARDCARLELFDYTAAQGYVVTVSLADGEVLQVQEADSSSLNLTEEEEVEARQIMSDDGPFREMVRGADWTVDNVALGGYSPGTRLALVAVTVIRGGAKEALAVEVDLVAARVSKLYPAVPYPSLSSPASPR